LPSKSGCSPCSPCSTAKGLDSDPAQGANREKLLTAVSRWHDWAQQEMQLPAAQSRLAGQADMQSALAGWLCGVDPFVRVGNNTGSDNRKGRRHGLVSGRR
jgi:hypothetical protein